MNIQSVVGILIQEGKVLLLKRYPFDRTLPDKLCLPGGKVEQNELYHHALNREFHEETGIAIFYSEYFTTESNDKFDIHFYLVEASDYRVTLSHEHVSYHWIDLHDLAVYKDQIAEKTYKVLNLLNNLEIKKWIK